MKIHVILSESPDGRPVFRAHVDPAKAAEIFEEVDGLHLQTIILEGFHHTKDTLRNFPKPKG